MKGFLQRILQEIIKKKYLEHQTLGRCDDRPIDPAYYIEDCRIFTNPRSPHMFRRSYRHRACRGSRWRDPREHSVLYRGSLLQLALATYFCPCYQPPQGKTNLMFYQGKYPSGCTYNFVSHIFYRETVAEWKLIHATKSYKKN